MNRFDSGDEEFTTSSLEMYGVHKTHWSFFILILMVAILFTAMPLIQVDISVRARGIVRPLRERTEVRTAIGGIVDSIFYHEGDLIHEGRVIVSLKDAINPSKHIYNQSEIDQCKMFIHDLHLLTSEQIVDSSLASKLISPLYRVQTVGFMHKQREREALIKKILQEEKINKYLFKEKVISPKEFADFRIEEDRANSSFKAFRSQQEEKWQQDLSKYRSMLAQLETQQNLLEREAEYYKIKSPVTGIIQQIHPHYSGDWLQPNEIVCSVSPGEAIVGECYIPSKDICLIRKGEPVLFQIDAFDYNYFGSVSGSVIFIDNDYTLIDGNPFFKVRCKFHNAKLRTGSGKIVELRKGLGFQARFIIARRSIWQLLFGKTSDWLNPYAS